MKIHQLFSRIELLLVSLGKGNSETTVRIGNNRIPIQDVIWCNDCKEFHIELAIEVVSLFDDVEDKINKSWLN